MRAILQAIVMVVPATLIWQRFTTELGTKPARFPHAQYDVDLVADCGLVMEKTTTTRSVHLVTCTMHAEMSNDMRKKKEKDMRGCFFRDREKQTVCGERKASKDKAQEKHKRGCLGMLLDVEHGERHV